MSKSNDVDLAVDISPSPHQIGKENALVIVNAPDLNRGERLVASIILTIAARNGSWIKFQVGEKPPSEFDKLLKEKTAPWYKLQTMTPLYTLRENGYLKYEYAGRETYLVPTQKLADLVKENQIAEFPLGGLVKAIIKWLPISMFTVWIAMAAGLILIPLGNEWRCIAGIIAAIVFTMGSSLTIKYMRNRIRRR